MSRLARLESRLIGGLPAELLFWALLLGSVLAFGTMPAVDPAPLAKGGGAVVVAAITNGAEKDARRLWKKDPLPVVNIGDSERKD